VVTTADVQNCKVGVTGVHISILSGVW